MQEQEERLILNKDSIKALSAETRISILKILSQKQQTLTDLSQILNLKPSTLKEHLDLLEKVDMIQKLEEGRKWKYYKISDKGLSLIYPERRRIWITLSILLVSVAGTIISLFFYSGRSMIASSAEITMSTFQKSEGDLIAAAPTIQPVALQPSHLNLFSLIPLFFTILALVSFFFLVYYIAMSKRKKQIKNKLSKQT